MIYSINIKFIILIFQTIITCYYLFIQTQQNIVIQFILTKYSLGDQQNSYLIQKHLSMLSISNEDNDNFISLSSIKVSQKKLKSITNGQKTLEFVRKILKKFSSMQLDHIPSEALKIIQSCQQTYYCPKGSISQEADLDIKNLKFCKILSIQPICHIDFPNLRFLILSSNNLSSIEALSFLNAPHLKKLGLQDNKISNLNPLHKGNFPELESLIFYGNPISSMNKIERSVSMNISYYKLDDSEVSYKNRVEDYRFLFKKLNQLPKYVGIEDENRISIKGKGFYNILQKQGVYFATFDEKIYLT